MQISTLSKYAVNEYELKFGDDRTVTSAVTLLF
jgi:hypothetical protein